MKIPTEICKGRNKPCQNTNGLRIFSFQNFH